MDAFPNVFIPMIARGFSRCVRSRAPETLVLPSQNGEAKRKIAMAMSMLSLLIHSHAVSTNVRNALNAAELAPVEQRAVAKKAAARLLLQESSIECQDARELLDLAPGSC
jgi:hypothetical protein